MYVSWVQGNLDWFLVSWYLPNLCTLSLSQYIRRVESKNDGKITISDPNTKNKKWTDCNKWFLDCHWTGYETRICLNSLGETMVELQLLCFQSLDLQFASLTLSCKEASCTSWCRNIRLPCPWQKCNKQHGRSSCTSHLPPSDHSTNLKRSNRRTRKQV